MCVSVCLCACQCVYVCPSVRLAVCLSDRLPACLSICLSVCPSVGLCVCLRVCVSVCACVSLTSLSNEYYSFITFLTHLQFKLSQMMSSRRINITQGCIICVWEEFYCIHIVSTPPWTRSACHKPQWGHGQAASGGLVRLHPA